MDLDDMINEEYERCYNVGFDHGRASCHVECEARIEAAFRAGVRIGMDEANDKDELWCNVEAFWAEYRKGGE